MVGFNIGLNPADWWGPKDSPNSNQDYWNQMSAQERALARHDMYTFYDKNQRFAREQMEKQEEFAKNALSWQYKQAKEAGLDPSVVNGAPGYSSTPVQIPGSPGNAGYRGGLSGQNTSRAFRAIQAQANINLGVGKAERERIKAETDLIKARRSALEVETAEKGRLPNNMEVVMVNGRPRLRVSHDYAYRMSGMPITSLWEDIKRQFTGTKVVEEKPYGRSKGKMKYFIDRYKNARKVNREFVPYR